MNQYNSERVEKNLKALSELFAKAPKADILKQYSGWGGLRNAIFTPDVFKRLKRHLSEEHLKDIKKTMTNAYYTPVELIEFIYRAVALLDKPVKTILEPSAGHGAFFEHMPSSLKDHATLYAFEIDEISRRLINHLYPTVQLFPGGFEEDEPSLQFDLIIGNPPYGREILHDNNHQDLSHFRIHHFFVAKSMRLLAPGGILAMVLPRYFMDNRKDHVREIIHQEGGTLVAAYRMPDNLFPDAKVTVDVVFMEKKQGDGAWIYTDKKRIDNETVFINRYFQQNPSHIIGQLALTEAYGRMELTCQPKHNEETYNKLFEQLDWFPPQNLINMEEYRKLLAEKVHKIDTEMNALLHLKTQIFNAQQNIQLMERQFLKHCANKFNLSDLLQKAL